MSNHHPLRCTCGALSGTLHDPPWVNRVICYCDSCQAFAERLGRGNEVLDAQGGSDILQTAPQSIAFDAGREHLACLRLTPRGPLRWYAACCNTPIGNTPANFRLSFIGLLHNPLGGHQALDAAFGPPRMQVFTTSARGDPKPKQHVPPSTIAAFVWRMAATRFTGRYKINPFFDEAGQPLAEPQDPGRDT